MHELSLCEGVIQLIEQQSDTQHFNKVTTVWLEIGALAGVEIEAMRFSFDAVANGTIADAAILQSFLLKEWQRAPPASNRQRSALALNSARHVDTIR